MAVAGLKPPVAPAAQAAQGGGVAVGEDLAAAIENPITLAVRGGHR